MLFCNWILGDVFMVNLSRLEEIKDLCTIWPHEALDFTPWLAQDDNCTSQQKLDTNFKYYLSINLISVQYGASFATFLSG